MVDLFFSESDGFHSTSRYNETLLLRPREGHDGATPSANAAAAMVMARLASHYDRASFRVTAEDAV